MDRCGVRCDPGACEVPEGGAQHALLLCRPKVRQRAPVDCELRGNTLRAPAEAGPSVGDRRVGDLASPTVARRARPSARASCLYPCVAMGVKEGWRGRFWEDFEVGDIYEHSLGRAVSATDNSWFTLLTQNTAPIHFDVNYAAQTEFGKPLVNSCLTLAIITGQSVTDIS